mmetsp:Transcript_13851/g.15396  ORF Transcript_13851/g.15396 Transcript_13851/m.15396 type:complete len:122 (-) Transcript_13851:785-1150(-)
MRGLEGIVNSSQDEDLALRAIAIEALGVRVKSANIAIDGTKVLFVVVVVGWVFAVRVIGILHRKVSFVLYDVNVGIDFWNDPGPSLVGNEFSLFRIQAFDAQGVDHLDDVTSEFIGHDLKI